jgi:hypothetical protein
MLIRNSLFVLFLTLAGCATPPPGIKTVIQKEEVPVAVPCKAVMPAVPAFNFDKLNPQQDVYTKTQALLADRLLHLGLEAELTAALNSCIK